MVLEVLQRELITLVEEGVVRQAQVAQEVLEVVAAIQLTQEGAAVEVETAAVQLEELPQTATVALEAITQAALVEERAQQLQVEVELQARTEVVEVEEKGKKVWPQVMAAQVARVPSGVLLAVLVEVGEVLVLRIKQTAELAEPVVSMAAAAVQVALRRAVLVRMAVEATERRASSLSRIRLLPR